jgi:hypothetical protein
VLFQSFSRGTEENHEYFIENSQPSLKEINLDFPNPNHG